MTADQIKGILAGLNQCSVREVTLEVNPVQINEEFLKELSRTRVNRLSIGVQSMNDNKLSFLGRKHRSAGMKQMMQQCRDYGYDNLSVDLIYGLPHEDCFMLSEDIDRILDLQPRHISAYLLSVESGSPLAATRPEVPSDEELAMQYDQLRQTLTTAGYEHYEISNFALPSYESRHNLHYWQGEEYIGLGASASGYVQCCRYTNPADIDAYEQQIDNDVIIPKRESLSTAQLKTDYLIMAFRLRRGIDRQEYQRRFGRDINEDFRHVFDNDNLGKMFEIDDRFIRLSKDALFVSNRILEEFV